MSIVLFSLTSRHKHFPVFNMEQEQRSWNSERLNRIRVRYSVRVYMYMYVFLSIDFLFFFWCLGWSSTNNSVFF